MNKLLLTILLLHDLTKRIPVTIDILCKSGFVFTGSDHYGNHYYCNKTITCTFNIKKNKGNPEFLDTLQSAYTKEFGENLPELYCSSVGS